MYSEWLDFSNDVKEVSIIVDSFFWSKKPHQTFLIYNLEIKRGEKNTSAEEGQDEMCAHKSGCFRWNKTGLDG